MLSILVAVAVIAVALIVGIAPAVLLGRRVWPDAKKHNATKGVYTDDLIGRIERMPVDQSWDGKRKRGK
jgi:hypothetical protein